MWAMYQLTPCCWRRHIFAKVCTGQSKLVYWNRVITTRWYHSFARCSCFDGSKETLPFQGISIFWLKPFCLKCSFVGKIYHKGGVHFSPTFEIFYYFIYSRRRWKLISSITATLQRPQKNTFGKCKSIDSFTIEVNFN